MTGVVTWLVLMGSTAVAGPPATATAAAATAFPPVVGWVGQFHGYEPRGHFHVSEKSPRIIDPNICNEHTCGFGPPIGFRTEEYFFNRQFTVPASQMFLSSYWNPYLTSGQRYIAYAGCGGCHPMSGSPLASAVLPVTPYDDLSGKPEVVDVPDFDGEREAEPVTPGSSGLIP